MKKLLIILAALLVPTLTAAAQAPNNKMGNNSGIIAQGLTQSPIPPQGEALTLNECVTIMRGLKGLDAYKYGNGALRGALGENQAELGRVADQIEQTRQKIFAEIAKDAKEIPPTITDENKKEHQNPDFAEYSKQLVALGASPCRATLTRIKRSDLKLDTNEIPGGILADIDKILDK